MPSVTSSDADLNCLAHGIYSRDLEDTEVILHAEALSEFTVILSNMPALWSCRLSSSEGNWH
jgi:hypothetical protein